MMCYKFSRQSRTKLIKRFDNASQKRYKKIIKCINKTTFGQKTLSLQHV